MLNLQNGLKTQNFNTMTATPYYLDQVQQPDDNHADLVKAFARRFIASQRGEFTVEDVRAAPVVGAVQAKLF